MRLNKPIPREERKITLLQHYAFVAQAIKGIKSRALKVEVVEHFIPYFEHVDPMFDRRRFIESCGFRTIEVTPRVVTHNRGRAA